MTTSTTPNGIQTLVPAEGCRLTNGDSVAEGVVYLGKLDGRGNWREITEAEAAAIIAAKEKAAEEELSGYGKEAAPDAPAAEAETPKGGE